MLEFIGLCVCSACLSCICCFITGTLCMIPAAVRARNKCVEKHFPDEMQWLGYLPPPKVCEENDSSSSDCCPITRDCPAENEKLCRRIFSEEQIDTADRNFDTDVRKAEKKSSKTCCVGSKPRRRWMFCFRRGKSAKTSNECCPPVTEPAKENVGTETPEIMYCYRKKKGSKLCKKFITHRKEDPKNYCAHFKSCSCTSFVEPAIKYCKTGAKFAASSSKCSLNYSRPRKSKHRRKRRSKTLKKFEICPTCSSLPENPVPNNCRCKKFVEKKCQPINERKKRKNCACRNEEYY